MPNENLILALETSGRVGSVALAIGSQFLAQNTFSGPMRHSAEIFPAIQHLLARFDRKPSQIGHIYISIGPGSFTGLRIAVTVAKAMNLANPVRIVAVDTLDVIAANIAPDDPEPPVNRIAAVLDAKRNQFYIAAYEHPSNAHDPTCKNVPDPPARTGYPPRDPCGQPWGPEAGCGFWNKLVPDSLMTAKDFLHEFADPADPIALLGDGLLYHADKFHSAGTTILDKQHWSPQAAKVHEIGYQLALAGKFADPLSLTPEYIRRPEAEEKWRKR